MSQNFVAALLTEKKVEEVLSKGFVKLTYENGSFGPVKYTYPVKSQEELEEEALEEEEQEIESDPNYMMAKVIMQMEIRRENYRDQDIIEYGYDKYLEEYEYEPEEEEEEAMDL